MGKLETIVRESTVKTIVLDFNGTLADDFGLFVEIGKKVFRRRGYNIPSDDEIQALRDEPAKKVMQTLLGQQKWLYRVIPALSEGLSHYFKEKNEVEPFDGIVDVINGLSKDYEILILSSNSRETVKYIADRWGLNYASIHHSLRWFGLERLFGKDKVLRGILKERDLRDNPETLLYMGDEARDVDACRKVGVNFVGVTWGYNSPTALTNAGVNPDYLVSDPHDIPNKIQSVQDRLKMGEKIFTLRELPKTPATELTVDMLPGSTYSEPYRAPDKPTTL